MSKNIAVIGSGSWATAIVKIVAESPLVGQISWWMRKKEYVTSFDLYGRNPNYLSSILFDRNKVKASENLRMCIETADFIVLAVPSAFVHETLKTLPRNVFNNKVVLTAVKGLVPETTQIVSDYIHTEFSVSPKQIACVSGPCHAEEVAKERLSYLTIASENKDLSEEVVTLFQCRYINSIGSDDITGIEYSAVLKNIYAIAAGIANGLGYGDNFKAVLISFAIREMETFLENLGIEAFRVNESAYLGDLLVTAYSQFSRNRTFGNMLGREYSVATAHMEMKMVAEGYYSSKQIFLLNQKAGAVMPVMEAVYSIIYQEKNAREVFAELAQQLN